MKSIYYHKQGELAIIHRDVASLPMLVLCELKHHLISF